MSLEWNRVGVMDNDNGDDGTDEDDRYTQLEAEHSIECITHASRAAPVSYTHLTLPTIYSV